MKGYYRAREETAAVLDKEGWFNTRDLVRFEQANLFIVGRTKELIIRFGFNIYPPEIEAVLNSHPAVMQSAVIGRPANGEEEVVAFVQPAESSVVTPRELADYAAQRLAPYKRPSRIFLVPGLPTSSTGKILKSQLAPLASVMMAEEIRNEGVSN
jgi:acyl-CoA synthetase (AMP-forming)/AMP-acid ligase II